MHQLAISVMPVLDLVKYIVYLVTINTTEQKDVLDLYGPVLKCSCISYFDHSSVSVPCPSLSFPITQSTPMKLCTLALSLDPRRCVAYHFLS